MKKKLPSALGMHWPSGGSSLALAGLLMPFFDEGKQKPLVSSDAPIRFKLMD